MQRVCARPVAFRETYGRLVYLLQILLQITPLALWRLVGPLGRLLRIATDCLPLDLLHCNSRVRLPTAFRVHWPLIFFKSGTDPGISLALP